jgi:thioredoxin-related protein
MRLPLAVILCLASPVAAQGPADPQPSARELALDNLLSERESEKAFQGVVADARKNGISEQAILEARFIYHVDRNEDDAIAALLPEFTRLRDSFRIEDSAIFGMKEDWLAVGEYVEAIAALKKGDKDAFKSHITEAFWLSPKQASAFAPHIERMRLEEAMQRVKIDFEIKLIDLGNGEATALKSLMGDQKAMILHFWSPASRECEESMADFITTAEALTKMKITFVSILPENSADILTKARTMIQPLGANAPGAWLIDRKENPLARELRVQSLPGFILVSNEGKILFNGDPADDGLWDALKKIDPKIKRPDSPVETN